MATIVKRYKFGIMREFGSGIWQAKVRLEHTAVEPFADLLDRDAVGISVFETRDDVTGVIGWQISALYKSQPDAGALSAGAALIAAAAGVAEPEIEIAPLPPSDWLAEAYAGFPARRIGRFFVHGSHIEARVGDGIPLLIDAATAFGSGEHATTEGCLLAMSDLARRGPRIARVLDMGTGSGILSVGMAKLFPKARIFAVDIDAESARVAAENARLNGVSRHVRAAQGNGYHSPLASRGPRFDVIIANILARPLIAMAPHLARRLRPGGIAILSGLLSRQERAVLGAHKAMGLRLVGRKPIGEWTTLILRQR
jgi:ribosomal protein L11 methyltransferase